MLPIYSAAIPFLGLVLIVAYAILRRRRWGKAHISTYVWAAVFACLELFMAVWCARSLCEASLLVLVIYSLVLAFAGIVVFQRGYMIEFQNRLIAGKKASARKGSEPEEPPAPIDPDTTADLAGALARTQEGQGSTKRSIGVTIGTLVRDAILVFLAVVLANFGLEVADNELWREIPVEYLHFDWLVAGLVCGALYFLGQRHGAFPAAGMVVLVVFGIAESFLDRFKNTAILPSDLTALGTAAAVAGGYTYTLNTTCLWSIIFGALALLLMAFVVPPKARKVKLPLRVLGNLACAALLSISFLGIYNGQDLQEKFNFKLWYWDLRVNYEERSTIVAFMAAAQDLKIDVPEGYTSDSARSLEAELDDAYDRGRGASAARQQASAQFEQTQPNVIAIMNESYADLSIFDDLHAGYTATPYLTNATDGMVRKGFATVSVHGGNTCNSEFELVSGISMGFIGYAKYPYLQYDFLDTNTLAKQFKALGYGTVAMHPNYPGNWNRETIYRNMGFDTTYFIYDFADDAPSFHSGLADGVTYDKVLESLKENDEPQFVFDVTMQNHGGYDRGNIPAEYQQNYQPSDFGDAESTAKLNEYLACVVKSDEDLKTFLDELSALDEPTVVVFYGDHQPNITRDINDALYPNEPELIHAARITKTPYFIWANYDVAGTSGMTSADVSVNFLGATLLETIGAPLSDYQKAQLQLSEQLPLVNANGYMASDGTWYSYDDQSPVSAAINQLNTLQYYNFAA